MGFFDLFRRKTDKPPNPRTAPRSSRLKRKVTKIEREVLEMVFESAKSSHPQEFGAVLRAEGDTITEILLVPTIQGDAHAIMSIYALPIDATVAGTIHSHPSPNPLPSHADEQLFRNFGHTHIIVAAPYDMRTWRAYDHDAQPLRLEVV